MLAYSFGVQSLQGVLARRYVPHPVWMRHPIPGLSWAAPSRTPCLIATDYFIRGHRVAPQLAVVSRLGLLFDDNFRTKRRVIAGVVTLLD